MRISDWSSDVCSSDLNMESPDIAAPMLDDFRHTFGGDMSPGTGPGTIHAYTSDVIHAAQLEGSVMASPAADVLAHHAIRLTSLYRMFMVGDHNEIGRASCRERGCQYV